MHLRFVPFPAIAVGGASLRFLADNTRAVGGSGRRRCSDVVAFSSSEKGPGPGSGEEREPRAEEALRRLAELDSQLEGLSEPRERPPAPPLPPDPYMDRDMITGRGSKDELPEFSPTDLGILVIKHGTLNILGVINAELECAVDNGRVRGEKRSSTELLWCGSGPELYDLLLCR
uniref:Uncharacterized protein n=1 Tax=Oryza nivara TaxID=4536 RepID=A0A0E0I2I1_ORYNI